MEGIRLNAAFYSNTSGTKARKRTESAVERMNKALKKDDDKVEEKERDEAQVEQESFAKESEKKSSISEKQKELRERLEEVRSYAKKMAQATEDAAKTARAQALSLLLKQVEAMNAVLYTPRSWNKLMSAYGTAKAVSLNSEASDEDIKKAITALRRAIAALEIVDIVKDDEEENEEDDEMHDGLPVVNGPEGSKSGASPFNGGSFNASVARDAARAPARIAGVSVDVSV